METVGASAPASGPDDAPPRARTRWPVWVAVVLATVVGAVGFAVVDRVPGDGGATRVERYLPPDGSVREVVDDHLGAFVVDSHRTIGYLDLFDLPSVVATGVAASLGERGATLDDARFMRELWTPRDPELDQVVALYWLAPTGVHLVSVSGGGTGFVYSPAMLVLPADARPGDTWSSSGQALPGGIAEYRSSSTASAREDGCLEVTTSTEYTAPGDGATDVATVLRSQTEVAVWCVGAGQVVSATVTDGVASTTVTSAFVGVPTAAAGAGALAPPAPTADWQADDLSLVSVDPVFGETALGIPLSSEGGTTASGVTVVTSGDDLVGLVVDGGRAVRRFVAHPGGEIVRVTVVGDLVLVATSERRLVAYDDRGARAWVAEFSDIVVARPVPDAGGGLVVVGLDGEVRTVDAGTGATRWTAWLAGDAATTPLVLGERVVVAGRDGSLTAFATADGRAEWSTAGEPAIGLVAIGDTLVVLTEDSTVLGVAPATGDTAWIRSTEAGSALASTGSLAIVRTVPGLEAYTADGDRAWTRALDGDALLALDGGVAVARRDEIELIDDDGETIAELPLPADRSSALGGLVARADGLLHVASDGRLAWVGTGR